MTNNIFLKQIKNPFKITYELNDNLIFYSFRFCMKIVYKNFNNKKIN